MIKKLIVAVTVGAFLGQNFAFAETDKSSNLPLKQIQEQAKKDLAAFQKKYPKVSEFLPVPSLLKRYKAQEIAALKEENAELKSQLDLQRAEIKKLYEAYENAWQYHRSYERQILDPQLAKTFSNSHTWQDIWLSSEFAQTVAHDADTKKLIYILEKGNQKAFEDMEWLLCSEDGTRKSIEGPLSTALRELQALYSQMKRLDKNAVMDFIPRLSRVLLYGSTNDRYVARSLGKQLLKRTGLLSGILIFIGATSGKADTRNINMARRIANHPELFLNASAQELAEIESNEFANKIAREWAELLHEATQLSDEDAKFIQANYRMQQTQQRTVKKNLTHQIQSVKVYAR